MAPLHVEVLFHPSSTRARELAVRLFQLLNGPSAGWGPRIPVRFGRDNNDRVAGLAMLDAERSLVVVLVDSRMTRRATAADRETADAWGRAVEKLLATYPPGVSSGCSVLPVAVDESAFSLSERLDDRSFVRLDAHDDKHLLFHVAIGCLRLMHGKPASGPEDIDSFPPVDIELFVSHAKGDLPHEDRRGSVAALLAAIASLPIKAWYDSSDIPVGAEFGGEIDRAVRRAAAVIVVLTDGYSGREWCRREVLAAKAAGRPIVVVDAIESQVVRLFPYVGNAPTVRWRAALARATGSAEKDVQSWPDEPWETEDASTVMLVTLYEALRYKHELERLAQFTETSADVVLGNPPEAITLPAAPTAVTRIIYPDPPLSREELKLITTGRPGLKLMTPLERFARWEDHSRLNLIALSLSAGSDADRYGGSEQHLATMAHDIALYLLLAGRRLLYGGVLGYGAAQQGGRTPGDDVDYVERLMELVERYSPMARELGCSLEPIENWVAWPLYEELTDDQLNKYRVNRATLTRVPPPDDLDTSDSGLRPRKDGQFADNTSLSRYVRARCLTRLRRDSTSAASARVAMGGKLVGYSGLVPGVAEEVLLTLQSGKPLYLFGAFGGAARAVIDVMQGATRDELTSAWCDQHVRGWRALMDESSRRDHPVLTPERVAEELRSRGAAGLSASLANGLTDEENYELIITTDAPRAVELVLRGLHAADRSGS